MRKFALAMLFIFSDFTYAQSLPEFSSFISVLLEVKPGTENVAEWSKIRNDIVSSSHKGGDDDRFYDLVVSLSKVEPVRHNKVEWRNIRITCKEIISDWHSSSEKIGFYRKLLSRLKETTPRRHNLLEWERIREVADQILRSM